MVGSSFCASPDSRVYPLLHVQRRALGVVGSPELPQGCRHQQERPHEERHPTQNSTHAFPPADKSPQASRCDWPVTGEQSPTRPGFTGGPLWHSSALRRRCTEGDGVALAAVGRGRDRGQRPRSSGRRHRSADGDSPAGLPGLGAVPQLVLPRRLQPAARRQGPPPRPGVPADPLEQPPDAGRPPAGLAGGPVGQPELGARGQPDAGPSAALERGGPVDAHHPVRRPLGGPGAAGAVPVHGDDDAGPDVVDRVA